MQLIVLLDVKVHSWVSSANKCKIQPSSWCDVLEYGEESMSLNARHASILFVHMVPLQSEYKLGYSTDWMAGYLSTQAQMRKHDPPREGTTAAYAYTLWS